MNDTIIIKLFRNDFAFDDYHDWMIDVYPRFLEELKQYLQLRGKKLYFTCTTAMNLLSGDTIAEILYTGTLSLEEREKCIETLKLLSSDYVSERRVDSKNYLEKYPPCYLCVLVQFKKTKLFYSKIAR